MTQNEFDELDATVAHLICDGPGPPRALCSGQAIDPDRWADFPHKLHKQCQACFYAAQRLMRDRPQC